MSEQRRREMKKAEDMRFKIVYDGKIIAAFRNENDCNLFRIALRETYDDSTFVVIEDKEA